MPLLTTRKESTYKLAPAGVHGATCVDVIDLGMIGGKFGFYHAVRIVWLIDKVDPEKNLPYSIGQRFGLELTPNGSATKLLNSWRGKALTDDEMDGFDMEALIGVNCTLNIVHQTKGDKVYDNIASIMPHTPGLPLPDTSQYVRHLNRTEYSSDVRNPVCQDYKGAGQSNGKPPQAQQQEAFQPVDDDDDLPF